MFTYRNNVPILKNIDTNFLDEILEILLRYNMFHNQDIDELIVIGKTKLNKQFDKNYSLFLNEYFFLRNRLDELLLPNNIENKALVEFSEGNYDKAEVLLETFQKEYNLSTNSRRKYIPEFYGFIYILLLFRNSKNAKSLKTHINNFIKEEGDFYIGLKEMYSARYESKERTSLTNLINYFKGNSNYLSLFFIYWLDKEKFLHLESDINSLISSFKRINLVLFSDTLSEMLNKAKSLNYNENTFNLSIANVLRTEENWEKDLAFFEKFSSNSVKVIKDEKASRIVWYVDFKRNYIVPVEQKLNKNGNWSKGRNNALKRLKEGNVENMTEADIKIATCVNAYTYGYYSHENYDIDIEKELPYLVDHPLVFLESSPSTKITIVKEKPEIIVKQVNNEYIVSIDSKAKEVFHNDFPIYKESLTKYLYFHLDRRYR